MPKKLALLASALVLMAIALRADDIVDEIIARVDDQIITRSEMEKAKLTGLEELKQKYPSDWQTRTAKAQTDILRDLIDQQLLLERGKDLGITGETEVVKRLNLMRQQMGLASIDDLEKEAQKQGVSYEDFKEQIRIGVVTQQVIGQEVGGKLHISNDDIQDWYNKHQKELEGQEEIGLSEIMVGTQPAQQNVASKDKQAPEQPKALPEDPAKVAEAEAKANQLLDQLKKGGKFEDLAKKNSDGPTAAQGGTLGTFKRGELSKDLEDKTFELKPGENTGVIRTKQPFTRSVWSRRRVRILPSCASRRISTSNLAIPIREPAPIRATNRPSWQPTLRAGAILANHRSRKRRNSWCFSEISFLSTD
jgi:peptidyl-prolyl cis-trans isomerase SurA